MHAADRDAVPPERARDRVAEGLREGGLVTVVGRCEVDYDGRATSYLGPGDRLLVCKPDGTVLVHTGEGRTPVNWQPPGADRRVRAEDGALVLESTRTNPDERLLVRFFAVADVGLYALTDDRALQLSGTEADLRESVVADPSLVEAGLTVEGTEVQTPAGPVDVLGTDTDGTPVVVELKRRRVGPDAVGQLARYVEALAEARDRPVRGILVAPSVTETGRDLLERRGLEFRSLAP